MLWALYVGMFNCYIVYVMSWKHLTYLQIGVDFALKVLTGMQRPLSDYSCGILQVRTYICTTRCCVLHMYVP